MTMSIRLALLAFVGLLIGAVLGGLLLGTACSGSVAPKATATPAAEESPTPFVAGTPTPARPLEALRVAYLNLMSPLEAGEGSIAWVTYGDRIDIAILDLREFDADLIGFSEAAWVKGLEENAWKRLQNGLALEPSIFARANPWPWNTSKDESDASVIREGYEEGEYLLSKYPITSSERFALARVSVSEGRAALHAVVKFPEPIGETDVYVARFGGADNIKEAQAVDLLQIIAGTHKPERPIIVMGDFGAGPDSAVLQTLTGSSLGLRDSLAAFGPEFVTCCRASIVAGDEGDETPTETATPEAAETAGQPGPGDPTATPPIQEPAQPDTMSERWDFVLTNMWSTQTAGLIGDEPAPNPQGQMLYPSDHNGIGVVLYVGGEPAR